MTDDTPPPRDGNRAVTDTRDATADRRDATGNTQDATAAAGERAERDGTTGLKDRIESALRSVRDPDADVNVFEAGLVESIAVDGGDVTVEAAVAEFGDENAGGIMQAMLQAVRDVPAVESAHVEPVAPSTEGEGGVADFGTVIAVASAKGGVGKSTVSTNLACALAGERATGLFDADIHGPNVPSLLDVSGPVHSDDEGSPLPIRASGSDAELDVMSVGLMESGAPLAWRGAMAHDALTELFTNTAWRADDTLVVDLPPGTGDVVLTTLQEVPVDGVVVVTTPFESSLEDTARSIELFRDNDVPVLGAVVNMGEFTCPSCGDSHDLFPGSSVEETLDAAVLAELPFSTEFQETPAPGETTPAFARLAEAVSEAAATAWDLDLPTDAVDIRGEPPEHRRQRVAEGFTSLDSGATFTLVSDRDPTPVREFLGGLTDRSPSDIEGFAVERRTPDDWVLTATRP
ncbi:ATP-binding protein involved in chromosome partitioning [Halogranum gelatinilyticum]|uniref:Iron-sulfur cluster carrier protein n=1 Tax=Halogranum gelatinilyticum TaxID=660521 RepID=A0A1G9YLS3_9EURY|nr:P-loop NTPase [Halogranum gelatinilyticum]SDN09977.1 ATP-binding protein involved in chromosome partitioning [Halogranum gelatinilyticum]